MKRVSRWLEMMDRRREPIPYCSDEQDLANWHRNMLPLCRAATIPHAIVVMMHRNKVTRCIARDSDAAELDETDRVDGHGRSSCKLFSGDLHVCSYVRACVSDASLTLDWMIERGETIWLMGEMGKGGEQRDYG